MVVSFARLHSAIALLVFISLLVFAGHFGRGARGTARESGPPPQTNHSLDHRTLIVFAYTESDFARKNLQFFVDHGLHAAADFVFVLNGDTDVADEIIFKARGKTPPSDRRNIYVKHRTNTCYDLGAHAEVLNGVLGGDGWRDEQGPIPMQRQDSGVPSISNVGAMKNRYQRFIMMNSSLRGPFVPVWSNSCWSDAYLSRVTSTIKLVGMSYNCHWDKGHVQSMIWATDKKGLDIILQPSGIDECFSGIKSAVDGEIRTTQLIRDNGYEVDALVTIYHSKDGEMEKTSKTKDTPAKAKDPGDFWKTCNDTDYLFPDMYKGTNVQPYETLFIKSQRHLNDLLLERLTEWHNGLGYSSYDYCS